MPALSNAGPVTCHINHVAGIKYPVAKQVVELEACTVDGPVVHRLRVVEVITFRRQHCEMLHVAPRQQSTSHIDNHQLSCSLSISTKIIIITAYQCWLRPVYSCEYWLGVRAYHL